MPLAAIHRNVIIRQSTCLYKDMSVAIHKRNGAFFFLLVSIIPAMFTCSNESIITAIRSQQLTAMSRKIKSFYCSTKRAHENRSHFSQNSWRSHHNSSWVTSRTVLSHSATTLARLTHNSSHCASLIGTDKTHKHQNPFSNQNAYLVARTCNTSDKNVQLQKA